MFDGEQTAHGKIAAALIETAFWVRNNPEALDALAGAGTQVPGVIVAASVNGAGMFNSDGDIIWNFKHEAQA